MSPLYNVATSGHSDDKNGRRAAALTTPRAEQDRRRQGAACSEPRERAERHRLPCDRESLRLQRTPPPTPRPPIAEVALDALA